MTTCAISAFVVASAAILVTFCAVSCLHYLIVLEYETHVVSLTAFRTYFISFAFLTTIQWTLLTRIGCINFVFRNKVTIVTFHTNVFITFQAIVNCNRTFCAILTWFDEVIQITGIYCFTLVALTFIDNTRIIFLI